MQKKPTKSPDSTAFLKRVFSEVPQTYERVNQILTLGLDRGWRRKVAKIAVIHGGKSWIDVCTGTGETAVYLKKIAPDGVKVTAFDLSADMLKVARSKPEALNITFVEGDVKDMPFSDDSFDLVTLSFATRNLNLSKELLTKAFSEICRILKPGGLFINLETSQPGFAPVRFFFHLYVKLFVKQIGRRISGSKDGYLYLSKTIPCFYNEKELAGILKDSGFKQVKIKKFLFGAIALHQSFK